jgi:hypothetical protein
MKTNLVTQLLTMSKELDRANADLLYGIKASFNIDMVH